MANEINLGYRSGATLTYGIYQPDGTVRVAAGTSLPEISSTGYYTASAPSMIALDVVLVKESTNVVAYGQFEPPVSTPFAATATDMTTVLADLTTVSAGISDIESSELGIQAAQGRVMNIFTPNTVVTGTHPQTIVR
jgi:hypothetical protein